MSVPIVPIAATYQKLKAENERLRKALDEIANPVKRMVDEANKKGAMLDGQIAIQLANNATYLREIAKKALEVASDA